MSAENTVPEPRGPRLWILAAFVVSRILYYAAGVRFDLTPLSHFFQIADPLLLRTRLLETCYYLHTQPPGFNFLIGVALKLFPESYGSALHAVYLLCGLSLCFTIYDLMRILKVRPVLAASLTALFLVSPGVVLYENFLLYEYPLTAVLCASAVLLWRLAQRPGFGRASAFFASLALLIYLRALFQLAWFVLIAAVLAWLLKTHRRAVLTAAIIPFLAVLGIYLKNVAVAGSFTSSTWLGFNADTITMHQLTAEEQDRLIAAGVISDVSRISSMEPLSAFRRFVAPPAPTGIPVLDQETDSTGRANYNNIGYLPLHAIYLRDAKAIILHYPRAYLRSLARGAFTYFLPSGDFPFFDVNRPHIAAFDRIFNIVFFGQWKMALNRKDLRAIQAGGGAAVLPLYTGTYLLIGLPLLFLWGVVRVWRSISRERSVSPRSLLLGYLLFQIAYVTAVVSLLSCFENNRYRLPIDPFFLLLLGVAMESGVRAFQSRSERTSPNPAVAI